MDLNLFFDKIKFPDYAREIVVNELKRNDYSKYNQYIENLTGQNAEKTYNELVEVFNDDDFFEILIIELLASLKIYEKYKQLGISDEIYFSTMGYYARYVKKSQKNSSKLRFNRAFWVWRHTSMQIFRVGQFEYEFTTYEDQNVISLHIPPDVVLTDDAMNDSFIKARQFVEKYYPNRNNDKIITETWLISPKLQQFLKPESNIRRFMSRFNVIKTVDHEYALRFLFDDELTFDFSKIDPKTLPEKTSLQRAVKNYYLEGGRIGAGYGILIE